MKRLLSGLLAVLATLSWGGLAWAGEDGDGEDAGAPPAYVTVEKIAEYIVQTGCGRDPAALERLDGAVDEETLEYYLESIYGLESGSWTDCAVYRAGGAEAFEIAVVRFADQDAAEAGAETLTEYLAVREGDFTGYAPEQADIVHGSRAAASEHADAALLICPDADAAESAFLESYSALVRAPFDPPQKDDMTIYDTSAVLAAWDSGDSDGLSEKDAAILDLAGAVIDGQTTPEMTDYEKEKALYAWVTANVTYDQDHYDPLKQPDPASYDPYGPLANGKGVCLGVASVFQLLMDMAGEECVTVVGASRASTADHAWNMVRLDGEWYCADPTWDIGGSEDTWDYFNVTSDRMAATDHQWDYETVPEAIATDGGADG